MLVKLLHIRFHAITNQLGQKHALRRVQVVGFQGELGARLRVPWSIIFDRDSDQEVSLFVQDDLLLMHDSVVARGCNDWDVGG